MWKTVRRVMFGGRWNRAGVRLENIDLPHRLKSILLETAWGDMQTARGDAAVIPDLLLNLFSDNSEQAIDATMSLEDLLCHQRAMLSEAAVPAAPIIFHALEKLTDPLVLQAIIETLGGLAEACTDTIWMRGEPDYVEGLLAIMEQNRRLLILMASHDHAHVSEFAKDVLEKLDKAKQRKGRRSR